MSIFILDPHTIVQYNTLSLPVSPFALSLYEMHLKSKEIDNAYSQTDKRIALEIGSKDLEMRYELYTLVYTKEHHHVHSDRSSVNYSH